MLTAIAEVAGGNEETLEAVDGDAGTGQEWLVYTAVTTGTSFWLKLDVGENLTTLVACGGIVEASVGS